MPSHRAGEITFYEELGVDQSASPEVIHDSFRGLVRILHPDTQTDESLKEVAEKQMRKLNRIYSVLADPDQRRLYDETLRGEDPPPTIIFSPSAGLNLRRMLARFAWIGAVMVSLVFLFWLASEGAGGPQIPILERGGSAAARSVQSPASGDPAEVVYQLSVDLRIARAERDAAIRQLSKLQGRPVKPDPGDASGYQASTAQVSPAATTQPVATQPVATQPVATQSGGNPAIASPYAAGPSAGQSLTTMTELPSAPKLPPAAKPAPSGTRFTGFWFYIRPTRGQHNNNQALYPPEFIEATITEQNGIVRGRYRSRYRIVDRAISPDVNFEFVGIPSGPAVACQWLGPGGARGDLTVRITGENAMRIDWKASELGSSQGLSSGTAILSRRVEQ